MLRFYNPLMVIIGSFLLLSSPTFAATFPVDSFESGDLSNWEISPTGQTNVIDNSFGVNPTDGNFQGLLETGEQNISTTPVFSPFDAPNTLEGTLFPTPSAGFLFDEGPGPISALGSYIQGSAIKYLTQLLVFSGDILEFDYNFLTDEINNITPNNDLAFLSINQTLIPITSVNTATFFDSATAYTSETNYQSFSYMFTETGIVTLGFAIVDENAASGQSGLLLDNIRISPRVPESSSVFGILLIAFLGSITSTLNHRS